MLILQHMELTIIVPTYNSAKYLIDCLTSLLLNSEKDFEIIIADGGSSDDTIKIIKSFVDRNPCITFFVAKDSSILFRIVLAAKKAKGKWVAVCDSDDTVDPNLYSFLISQAKTNKCDFSACNVKNGDHCEHIRIREGVYTKKEIENEILPNSDANCAFWGNTWHSFVCHPDAILKEADLLLSTPNQFCDVLYFYSALLSCSKAFISDNPLYFYRVNTQSSTHGLSLEKRRNGLVTYRNLSRLFSIFKYDHFFPSLHHILYTIVFSIISQIVFEEKKKKAIDDIRLLISDPFIHSCFVSGTMNNSPYSNAKQVYLNFLIRHRRVRALYLIIKIARVH